MPLIVDYDQVIPRTRPDRILRSHRYPTADVELAFRLLSYRPAPFPPPGSIAGVPHLGQSPVLQAGHRTRQATPQPLTDRALGWQTKSIASVRCATARARSRHRPKTDKPINSIRGRRLQEQSQTPGSAVPHRRSARTRPVGCRSIRRGSSVVEVASPPR